MRIQYRFCATLCILALFVGILHTTDVGRVVSRLNLFDLRAAVFPETITPESLRARYQEGILRVLVVPGHDLRWSGAEYRGTTEAEMNIAVARELVALFSRDPRFFVLTTRDLQTQDYSLFLKHYLAREEASIHSFIENRRTAFSLLLDEGRVESNQTIEHNFAPGDMTFTLYGINKWASEHAIDLVVHLHFNDYGSRTRSEGKYSGFAIYIPERQYGNARASRAVAELVHEELSEIVAPSNFPKEAGGIVESQELIALGSNASQDGLASLLIEYGYIYEPQFQNREIRDTVFAELALQTYQGIKRYFDVEGLARVNAPATHILPHEFSNDLSHGDLGSNVLALQVALSREGVYPPKGYTLSECPINGSFKGCVEAGVRAFQEKYADEILIPARLTSGTGFVGNGTRAKLNELYGERGY